jgi:outer membrane protein
LTDERATGTATVSGLRYETGADMILRRAVALTLLSLLGTTTAGAQPTPPAPSPAPRTLTLAEALRVARERQPQLRQARATVDAAVARADAARSALLPQVSASAAYQRTTSNFSPRPGLTTVTGAVPGPSWDTRNFWNLGITASELVYDFGQTSGRWRAAQAVESAQRGTERATLLQALLTVRATYFNARAGKDLVGVARETFANQEAHLRQIEGFVRIGTRPEIDLAQARTDRANAEVQLINAENAYATARAQLNQAMGIEESTDYEVADEVLPPVPGEDLPLEALVTDAVATRPDLRALEELARAQQLTIGAVRGAYFPALGVSTGFTDAGGALDSLVWNWNVTATLTWNLFQGGLTRAQEREARANLEAAQAQLDSLRQQVRVELEEARLAVRAAKGALGASDVALTNARERLRLAEGRYQAGVGSVIELGDAQVALTAAAAQRVQARYNLSASRAQLLRALGREGEVLAQ